MRKVNPQIHQKKSLHLARFIVFSLSSPWDFTVKNRRIVRLNQLPTVIMQVAPWLFGATFNGEATNKEIFNDMAVEPTKIGGFYPPKWIVYNGKPIKMDDLRVPLFLETSILYKICDSRLPPRHQQNIDREPIPPFLGKKRSLSFMVIFFVCLEISTKRSKKWTTVPPIWECDQKNKVQIIDKKKLVTQKSNQFTIGSQVFKQSFEVKAARGLFSEVGSSWSW